MVAILSEEGVLRYFPESGPLTRERVDKMIARLLKHWEEHGYGLWAVISPATGDLLRHYGM